MFLSIPILFLFVHRFLVTTSHPSPKSHHLILQLPTNATNSFPTALESFRAHITQQKISLTERRVFNAFGGLSVYVEHDGFRMLRKLKGVKVWNVHHHPIAPSAPIPPDIPGTYLNLTEPLMHLTHRMTGLNTLRSQFPTLDGSGVKVGIIDTGIDYTHPGLGGCFGEGCRVAVGYDFVDEDADPMDCDGHGTHVAGIVAGQDERVNGVAPVVTLGAYKVFSCEGGTNSELILSALEKAYEDGMNIVNLSLGSGAGWPDSPEAAAATSLVDRGVWVVAAQGNEGTQGLFSTPAPAVSPTTLSVTSTENTYFLGGFLTLSTDTTRNITYASTSHPLTLPPTAPLIVSPTDGCELNATPSPFPNNSIILVKRGICSFNKKAGNVRDAGGVGMIVWNDREGLYRFALEKPVTTVVIVSVSREDGEWMGQQIGSSAGAVTINWDGGLRVLDNPDGGKVADYSTWGPAPSLQIKPDMSAPGSIVYSTFPVAKGSYYPLSGTSMATPYITGCLSLLHQHIPNLTFPDAISLLQSTSTPIPHATYPNTLATIASQGTGMINIQAALTTTVILTPAKISLGETTGPVDITLNLLNTGPDQIEYTLGHTPSSSLNVTDPTITPPIETDQFPATATFTTPTITIQPNEPTTLTVTLTPPNTPSGRILYSGIITLTPSTGPILHTTYLSLLGTYTSLPLLPTNGSYPYILHNPSNTTTTTDPITFIPANGESLDVVFTLQLPARSVTLHLLNTETSEIIGLIARRSWLGRNDPTFLTYKARWSGGVGEDDGGVDDVGGWEDMGGGEVGGTVVGVGEYVVRIEFERDVVGGDPVMEEWVSSKVVVGG